MRSFWVGWALNPMSGTLRRRGEDTQRRKGPFEGRGRDWGETTTSQGTPRIAGSHQKLQRGKILP